MKKVLVLALVLIAGFGDPDLADAQDDFPKLSLTGTGTFLSVIPGGAERFAFQLELKNLKPQKVRIPERPIFLASQGGWSRPLLPANWVSMNIGSKEIAASAIHTLNYESPAGGESVPASYVFARLRVIANGKSRVLFTQIPIKRASYVTPPPLPRLTIINPTLHRYSGTRQCCETFKWKTLASSCWTSNQPDWATRQIDKLAGDLFPSGAAK